MGHRHRLKPCVCIQRVHANNFDFKSDGRLIRYLRRPTYIGHVYGLSNDFTYVPCWQ